MTTAATMVFLPGLLCDARLWRDQAAGLADVVTPVIPDLTQDDSIAAMAQRVLGEAPERFILTALSMGGYVVFEIMRQAPERVIALALFDTTAAPDTPARAESRRAGIASLAQGRFMGVTTALLPQLVHPVHLDGPVGQEVQAMAARVGAEAYIRQQTAILGRIDSRPSLAAIAVPTLVAVGDSDLLTPPSEAQVLHNGIAGSRLHIFPRCGHLPVMEQPDAATALLRGWLASLPR